MHVVNAMFDKQRQRKRKWTKKEGQVRKTQIEK